MHREGGVGLRLGVGIGDIPVGAMRRLKDDMTSIYPPFCHKGVQKKALETVEKIVTSSRYCIPNKSFENDTEVGFDVSSNARFLTVYLDEIVEF